MNDSEDTPIRLYKSGTAMLRKPIQAKELSTGDFQITDSSGSRVVARKHFFQDYLFLGETKLSRTPG